MPIVAQNLSAVWQRIAVCLLPRLEECFDQPLTQRLEALIAVLEVVRIEDAAVCQPRACRGRPRHDRRFLARAFVAKALFDLPCTTLLLEMLHLHTPLRRLCGWERRHQIPSAATFSRAFAAFAAAGLGDSVHAALVAQYVDTSLVLHLSRDATAICAREKPAKKPPCAPAPARKRGRPRKGEERPSPAVPRLQRQLTQSVEQALSELPRVCDVGTKTNAKGFKQSWVGWKSHIDWTDGGLPVNVVTTSASLHDSQVAIPMARQTAQRVTSLYDLMDAAYDAAAIRQVSEELGHVPLIESKRGGKEGGGFDPVQARRYQERTTAERGNSRLKDAFGGRHLRVRGHAKAHLHIMFGILVLFADQLLKPCTTG